MFIKTFSKPWILYDAEGGGGSGVAPNKDAAPAPVTAGSTQGGEGGTPPTPVVAPVEGAEGSGPEFVPEPGPTLPGEGAVDDANWLRAAVTELSQKYQAAAQRLEEYETAGLDDDEKARISLQREREALQRERAQMQANYATGEWKAYYAQFKPPTDALQGDDPVKWQHNVLTHLHKERQVLDAKVAKLNQQLEALKLAAAKPAGATPEPVGGGSGAPNPGVKTIDQISWDELEDLQSRALAGLPSTIEYPTLPPNFK
jgi:hypothetical protein